MYEKFKTSKRKNSQEILLQKRIPKKQ